MTLRFLDTNILLYSISRDSTLLFAGADTVGPQVRHSYGLARDALSSGPMTEYFSAQR